MKVSLKRRKGVEMKERIYCETNKERDKVLKRLEEMGHRWLNGSKLTEWKGVYDAPMTIVIEDGGRVSQGNYKYVCTAISWLEGYEDCNQVEKFDEFVSYLKTPISDGYGKIGDDTPIKDVVGRDLRVGDTVKVVNKAGEDYGEKVIVKDEDKAFVMGFKGLCKKDGFIDGLVIIKKRSFEEIKDGETVDGFIYVKSKRLNTKICITRGDINFKTGKIYKVIDGKLIDDDGDELPTSDIHLLKDIEDLKEYFAATKDRKRCENFPHWSTEGIDFVEVVE